MSTTTANSTTTTNQRLQQRERERQQRGLQFQQDNSIPFPQIANGNVHFSEPIKHEHEDATAKRIKDTLGEHFFKFSSLFDFFKQNLKTQTNFKLIYLKKR